jgi:hypothetical protein
VVLKRDRESESSRSLADAQRKAACLAPAHVSGAKGRAETDCGTPAQRADDKTLATPVVATTAP